MLLKRCIPGNIFLVLFFTTLSLVVMGYHPGFEDDGIYLTAVKSNLNSALYPHDAAFSGYSSRLPSSTSGSPDLCIGRGFQWMSRSYSSSLHRSR
jgi:hypothetical protein